MLVPTIGVDPLIYSNGIKMHQIKLLIIRPTYKDI